MQEIRNFEQIAPELREALTSVLGDQYEQFLQSPEEPPCVRINTLKVTPAQYRERLEKNVSGMSSHPFNPDSFILSGLLTDLTHSLSFYRGEIVVQGVSSQIPVLALDPQPGENVLDMAASPGSKSTQIAALMQNRGKLLLCDPSVRRQQPLLANLSRTGVMNDVVLQIAGQRAGKLFPEFFDRVLLDAPCSALSKLQGKESIRGPIWKNSMLSTLMNTQYHLLVSAIKTAKKGGVIVYSTCTLTVEENEALINRIIAEYPVVIEDIDFLNKAACTDGFTRYQGIDFHPDLARTKRILPFQGPFEAFYVARLRKTASIPARGEFELPVKPALKWDDPEIAPVLESISERWGIAREFFQAFYFFLTSKKIWIASRDWEYAPDVFFVKAGLPLAERKTRLWKLTTAGAQFLDTAMTRSFITLESSQMLELYNRGELEYPGHTNGYYGIEYNGRKVGAGTIMDGVFKMTLPHRSNLKIW